MTSPGPNLFLLLRTTPAFGRAAGLANTFGFAAAILSHALLSLIGVGAVIATSAVAFSVLKFAGAAYLTWLGIKALLAAWSGPTSNKADEVGDSPQQGGNSKLGGRFIEGYLTNILNPKPAIFYLAAFPQFISLDGLPILLQGVSLGLIHASIAILWYGAVVLGMATVSRWMRRPAVWRAVQTVSGTALVALGARLVFVRQGN